MTVVRKYGLGLIVFSALAVTIFLGVFLSWQEKDTVQAAVREARDYYALHLYYRAWNANLGGVYAPVEKILPNPYLDHASRDVTLSDGRQLTLVNPAYMTRLVFALTNADPANRMRSRLVSLKPLNPDNAASDWEAAALRAMENDPSAEFSRLAMVDGQEYLQFLGPFVTTAPCLQCHERQGYQVGDLRGAISLSIPMDKYRAVTSAINLRMVLAIVVLWAVFSLCWAVLSRRRFDKELALQLSEERNRMIFETSQAAIFMVDPRGLITVANRRMSEMFGYPLDELIGKLYPELICADERRIGDARMHQLMNGEIPGVSFERHYRRRDGSEFWGHLSGRRLNDPDGRLLALVGVISDISPLRQAIDEVNQAKDYFFSILNTIADPVFVKDDQYRLVLVNDAACRILGRDRTEILGKTDADFFPDEETRAFREIDELILTSGEPRISENTVTVASGLTRVAVTHKSCYVDQHGRRFIVGVVRDVTEQKALEYQAMRSAQLAAVGELATGVAHEINNPITGVINCAQLLIDRQAVAEKEQPVLKRIIREGERVAAIVRSLLFFSRDSGDGATRSEIKGLLAEVLQLTCDQLARDGIDLRINLPEEAVFVEVNPQKFEQVLLNLISNARYALNERGKSDATAKVLCIQIETVAGSAGKVCRMTVGDNGTGIPAAILEKLGRPFVTTKPAGIGTGLGLSISKEIVKRCQGDLRIISRVGEYTEVVVELPAL